MIRYFIYILILILFVTCGIPLHPQEEIFLSDSETDGGETVTRKTYDGSSLWGYINGGADLYLEYGFKKLYLQEIRKNGITYKIEIYEMNDPESAFGIFSVSRYKCGADTSIPVWNCAMPYQTQFVKGSYYVSVSNVKASSEEQDYTRFLSLHLVRKMKGKTFAIPEVFRHPVYRESADGLMMIKGPLGLMNGYPDWIDRFENYQDFRITVLPIRPEQGHTTIARIHFAQAQDQTAFINSLNMNIAAPYIWVLRKNDDQTVTAILVISEKELYYAESTLPEKESVNLLDPIREFQNIIDVK